MSLRYQVTDGKDTSEPAAKPPPKAALTFTAPFRFKRGGGSDDAICQEHRNISPEKIAQGAPTLLSIPIPLGGALAHHTRS